MSKQPALLGQCIGCGIRYPEEILWLDVCGICALERSNRELGIDRKKFDGEMAEDFRQAAIAFRKKLKVDRHNKT